MRLAKIVKATVAALEDIKARDIVVLDVRPMTSLFNWMIVASADSTRQAKALSSNVREKLKVFGAKVRGVEGQETGEWVLVDLGEVVVHIMQPAVRKYYNLEQLWGGSRPMRRARKAARV
ncbi:MAG TPA: ribosome silencing factor [Burkholderiales bacterium]|nr:ribosome silencing factor [Burkholderiales bacterium]